MSGAGGSNETITAAVTPQELQREARRLLPLLAHPGAYARKSRLSSISNTSAQIEIVRKANQKRPSAHCECRIIDALCRQEWIACHEPDQWAITALGAKFLTRHSAGEEGFRAQHQKIVERVAEMPDGSRRPVRVNEAENPLIWLRRHKMPDGSPFLDDNLFAAGERLHIDFTKAQLQPSVTTNWAQVTLQGAGRNGAANGIADLNEAAQAARKRFEKALALIGPEMASATVDVCCFSLGLGEVERARHWPQRSAKLVIRLSLGQLARHYGLISHQR